MHGIYSKIQTIVLQGTFQRIAKPIVFPYLTENAYFAVAMRTTQTDPEVPQIITPKNDIKVDTGSLVVVFGCLFCDKKYALKVKLNVWN